MLILINYFYNVETFFPGLKRYIHGFIILNYVLLKTIIHFYALIKSLVF